MALMLGHEWYLSQSWSPLHLPHDGNTDVQCQLCSMGCPVVMSSTPGIVTTQHQELIP